MFLAGQKSDKQFFDLLQAQAGNILVASDALICLTEEPSGHCQAAVEMEELEHKGDEITHKLINLLNQVFVTPLDRDEIHLLASHMDNIVDGIEKVTARIDLYELNSHDEFLVKFAKIIKDQAVSLQSGIAKLCAKQLSSIRGDVVRINDLESQADKLLRDSLKAIIHNPSNILHLILLKEVYETLEDTTDRFEDVGNILESVVMRNA